MVVKYRMIFLCFAAAFLWNCGYVEMVGHEMKKSFSSIGSQGSAIASDPQSDPDSVLMGKITGGSPADGPLTVVACSKQFSTGKNTQTMQLAAYIMLPEPGAYTLFVTAGRYNLFAFIDSNRNFILEQNEWVGQYGNPDLVSVKADQVIGNLDIEISATTKKRFDFPISLQKLPLKETNKSALENGGVIQLDDEIFLINYGTMGLWRPDEFIKKLGIDVYAPDRYDPDKIPVLFVHGAGGTPRDWLYLVKRVDRQYFQPWFYYYPSGVRLTTVSDLLYQKIQHLHETYRFDRLYIVAHSMGGLVARSFINRCGTDNTCDFLRVFISISTPWGGEKSANLGVKSAPVYVASWEDLATGSRFLEDLYQNKMPPQLKFYIFFSYGGNRRIHWAANDGTVTLPSQLDPRAKSDATRIDGFYEDHTGILHCAESGEKFEQILASERIATGTMTARAPQLGTAAMPPVKGGTKTISYSDGSVQKTTEPVDDQLPPEANKYITMLKSKDSARQREAARRIYKKRLKSPELFDAAEVELKKGYLVNLNDSGHIDAMAWMCTLLGASGQVRYRATLETVARETPNAKIRNRALRSMKKLR